MATITKLKSGHWRVQARHKQSHASETFLRCEDARRWAIATEHRIDLGEFVVQSMKAESMTLADLVDLYIDDMCEVGKAPQRSKRSALEAIRGKLGPVKI